MRAPTSRIVRRRAPVVGRFHRITLIGAIGLGVASTAAIAAPPAVVAPRPAPQPLIGSDHAWRWQVVSAPRLAPQIGALAIHGLDVVAGRDATRLDLLGAVEPPAAWPNGVDHGSSPALPRAPTDARIAAAFGHTTFTLAATDQGLEMLELRLRYRDGIAVWLNGVEIARRALPRTPGGALARRPHGPEWETVYVPVGPMVLRLGANHLAIEVHPSHRRDAPSVDVELIGRRDRGIVRGPVLAAVGASTAQIAVDTDPDIGAELVWSAGGTLDSAPDPAGGQVIRSPPGRHHVFSLTGLPVRGHVRYRVHAGAGQSAVFTFQTAPTAGETVRIGVYGDVRGGHAVHRRLVDAMLAEPLDLIAVTGDMVLRGADEGDWQRFFAITAPLLGQILYLPAVGNHDLGWGGARPDSEQVFALPPAPAGRPPGAYWYSVDLADVHLVFLDSNAYERIEQDAWLEADLAAARARRVRAIVAFTHDGPYSRGYHRGNRAARTRLVPILARHRVDLLLAGHDHLYQRGEVDGVRYVVTGGGGASLYAISCGARGKPRCTVEDGMQAIAREHHYVILTIRDATLELCARRPDGRLLEPCVRYPLR